MPKLNLNTQVFSHVSFLDKLLFTKHLAVMIKSGIPLPEAIDTIREQATNHAFRDMLEKIGKEVENGQSFEKALSNFPKVFDPLYLNLVRIGEESGNLETNLDYLASELKKDYDFKKKVQGAMLYPAIVLVAATLVGGGTSFFVLPKLVDLFKSLDTNLPLSTKILLFMAQTMKDYGLYIFIGLVLLIVSLRALVASAFFKPKWHRFILTIPALGLFLQEVQLTSLCRNLGIMLKSGLPIINALEAQEKATTNLIYKDYISKVKVGVEKGHSMHEEMSRLKFKYIPAIVIKMIEVGEKTGKLEESLLYLGDFFEDEVDNNSKNFANILEPILLLVIGLIVAFVAISIISPIYQLTGSIKAR